MREAMLSSETLICLEVEVPWRLHQGGCTIVQLGRGASRFFGSVPWGTLIGFDLSQFLHPADVLAFVELEEQARRYEQARRSGAAKPLPLPWVSVRVARFCRSQFSRAHSRAHSRTQAPCASEDEAQQESGDSEHAAVCVSLFPQVLADDPLLNGEPHDGLAEAGGKGEEEDSSWCGGSEGTPFTGCCYQKVVVRMALGQEEGVGEEVGVKQEDGAEKAGGRRARALLVIDVEEDASSLQSLRLERVARCPGHKDRGCGGEGSGARDRDGGLATQAYTTAVAAREAHVDEVIEAKISQTCSLSIYTYIHTYINTCMHACMHTYIHTYMNACMYACMHTCIHTYIHTERVCV